jgi:hypothetical protein
MSTVPAQPYLPTTVGAGRIGKTKLAIEAERHTVAGIADGV